MKYCLWALLCGVVFAGTSPARAADPTPEDIIKKMLQIYRTAKTYTENATESMKFVQGNQERLLTSAHRFSYETPNKFYYDVRVNENLMEAVASDGQTLSYYSRRNGRVRKTDAPAKVEGLRPTLERIGLVTQDDPFAFLVGEDPLGEGTKVTLVKTETVAGKPVYQLELTQPDGQKKMYWIGKEDHLLYRLQQTITQTRNDITVTMTVTETHSDMKLNETLPADAFTLKTPPGTAEIADLLNKPAPGFTLKDLDGNPVTLSTLKGKTVVINFWAFW